MKVSGFMASRDETFVFEPWIMTKVYEQTELAAGRAEIIQDLCAVLIAKCRDGLDFNNDFVVANEIRTECLHQRAPAILQSVRQFRAKRNRLEIKFDFDTLVVNRLVKTAALVLVNAKTGSNDGVAFLFVDQFCFVFVSCHFVCFVGYLKTAK